MDNTKPQSILEYATSTLNLGLPCLRLTNLKCPTFTRISNDLDKFSKLSHQQFIAQISHLA